MRTLLLLCCLVACGDDDGMINPDGGVDAPSVSDTGPDTIVDAPTSDVSQPDATPLIDSGTGPTITDISNPMMDPRQSFSVGFVGDGRVIFAGGFGGDNTPNETWAFDPTATAWSQLADLPAPHIGASAVVLPDGRMLISGGVPGQFARESNDGIFVFDPSTNLWSAAGTMTETRGGHAVYMLTRGPDAGKLVMFGGSRRTESGAIFLTTFELYDPTTEVSTPLTGTELPSSRAGYFAYALDDGRIVIAGGYTDPGSPDDSAINEILIYDPMDHSVTTQDTTLPESHLLTFMGVMADGRGLVLPGRYSTNTIRAMDLNATTFTDIGALPENLTSYGLALARSGLLYLFGGRADGEAHTDIHVYDPQMNEWSMIPDILPAALAAIAAVPLPDGRVILMGGQTDLGFIVGETNLFTP